MTTMQSSRLAAQQVARGFIDKMKSKSNKTIGLLVVALLVLSFLIRDLSIQNPKPVSGALSTEGVQLWQDAYSLIEPGDFVPGQVTEVPQIEADVQFWRDFESNKDFVIGLYDCSRLELNGKVLFDLRTTSLNRQELLKKMDPAVPEEEGEGHVLYRLENGDLLIFSIDSRDAVTKFDIAPSERTYGHVSYKGESVQVNDPRLPEEGSSF